MHCFGKFLACNMTCKMLLKKLYIFETYYKAQAQGLIITELVRIKN